MAHEDKSEKNPVYKACRICRLHFEVSITHDLQVKKYYLKF